MASTNITITIVDEGYFKKVFSLSPKTRLKKLLDRYRVHICDKCSNAVLLDFWYETTKVGNRVAYRDLVITYGKQVTEAHTAEELGMQTGDIIDIRVAEQCTRGSCPIPTEQTLPNIHYLADMPAHDRGSVLEQDEQPAAPKRITLKIRDQNGFEVTLAVKTCTPFRKIKEAFATQAEKDALVCRLCLDGKRLGDSHSPETVSMSSVSEI